MDAGNITVKINGDTTNLQKALSDMNVKLNDSKKSAENTSIGIFKGLFAFESLKLGVEKVIEVVKESIQAFREQDLAEERLRQVTTGGIEEFKKYASQIQSVTTVGDEMSLQIMAMAKTMGISQDKLKDVTRDVISLSKAFNIDLMTATKMITLAQQGNYDLLQRYVPALRTVKDETEKQAILNEALAKGWKIATSEATTFSGSLDRLKNIQGDVKEEMGRVVSVIGRDFVNAQIKATQAIADWIGEAKNQNAIISLFQNIGSGLTNTLVKLKENFTNLFSQVRLGKKDFDIFGIVITGLNVGITVYFKTLQLVQKIIFDFINIHILAAKAVGNLWTLLTGSPSEKEKAKKNFDDIGQSLANMGKGYVDWGKDLISSVKETLNQISGMSASTPTISMGGTTAPTQTTGGGNAAPQGNVQSQGPQGAMKLPSPDTSELEKGLNVAVSLYTQSSSQIANIIGGMASGVTSNFSNITTAFSKSGATIGEQASSIAQSIGDAFNAGFAIAKEATDQFFSDQIAGLQATHDSEIEAIQTRLDTELEMIEYNGQTKEEFLNSEVIRLQKALTNETNATKKADIEKELSNTKKEIASAKAKKDADKEKSMSDYKMAKAKWDLDKQAFETNKVMSMINATIQFMIGLVMLWANVWSIGNPIAAAVIGGVMSGVLTGIFAASMAVMGSQQFSAPEPEAPKFASGGIVGGNMFTGDQVNARLNSGEMVLNQEQQANLFSALNNNNNSGQVVNLIMDGDILKTWYINNSTREALLA